MGTHSDTQRSLELTWTTHRGSHSSASGVSQTEFVVLIVSLVCQGSALKPPYMLGKCSVIYQLFHLPVSLTQRFSTCESRPLRRANIFTRVT